MKHGELFFKRNEDTVDTIELLIEIASKAIWSVH